MCLFLLGISNPFVDFLSMQLASTHMNNHSSVLKSIGWEEIQTDVAVITFYFAEKQMQNNYCRKRKLYINRRIVQMLIIRKIYSHFLYTSFLPDELMQQKAFCWYGMGRYMTAQFCQVGK